MWIFWAIVAMVGSGIWYLVPKFFPVANPFSAVFFSSAIFVVLAPICSKIFYKTWFDLAGFATGIAFSFSILATLGLIMAINAGGKVGPISVIIELSVIVATLVAVLFFHEKLVWPQMVGILLAVSGICLVLFFEK